MAAGRMDGVDGCRENGWGGWLQVEGIGGMTGKGEGNEWSLKTMTDCYAQNTTQKKT